MPPAAMEDTPLPTACLPARLPACQPPACLQGPSGRGGRVLCKASRSHGGCRPQGDPGGRVPPRSFLSSTLSYPALDTFLGWGGHILRVGKSRMWGKLGASRSHSLNRPVYNKARAR